MSNQEKIEAIRAKCIETNPEIEETMGFDMCSKKNCTGIGTGMCEGDPKKEIREIRLADVLLAFAEKIEGDYQIEENELIFLNPDADEYEVAWKWNLRKDDLTQQSEETIDFIAGLLDIK